MINITPPQGLEERFLEPPGFRWHSFNRNGRNIRFGSIFPKDSIPDAVVVCLPGLSEYGEKYYEIARDLQTKNLAFWVIDWMGQGASDRYLPNLFKRHSAGFHEDVEDLHYLVEEYIKHSSVHPDKGRIPLAMLAHSMGGNIGLRYLAKYPEMFECAAFSAPMVGIDKLTDYPQPLMLAVTGALNLFAPNAYAPSQKDWHNEMRPNVGKDQFSSDPVRGAVHEDWLRSNPALQIGGVTNRWLYEALKSCYSLQKSIPKIRQDILIGVAEHEKIVSNRSIINAFDSAKSAQIILLDDAKHEILMETDSIRTIFMDGFMSLIDKTIIQKPETLKPF